MACCVGLTLWLMMHWLGVPDTPEPIVLSVGAPADISPPEAVLWLDRPLRSYYDCMTCLSNNVRELWKKIGCSQILEGTRHTPGPYSKVTGERGRECGPGALPLLVSKGGVPRVSWVHSLLANWKHESWNYDAGREKWGYWSSQLSRFPRVFMVAGLQGRSGLALYVSSWQCVCWRRMPGSHQPNGRHLHYS